MDLLLNTSKSGIVDPSVSSAGHQDHGVLQEQEGGWPQRT